MEHRKDAAKLLFLHAKASHSFGTKLQIWTNCGRWAKKKEEDEARQGQKLYWPLKAVRIKTNFFPKE
jgi:hypothetical protein